MREPPRNANEPWETSDQEKTAAIVEAFVRAARAVRPQRSTNCVTLSTFDSFRKGSLTPTRRFEVISHIAECGACRSIDFSLRRLQRIPSFNLHLPTVRVASRRKPEEAAVVTDDLRNWLGGVLRPDYASAPLLVERPAEDLRDGEIIELVEDESTSIDAQGRFILRLAPPNSLAQMALVVAIQDEVRRLELTAIPFREGRFEGVVDLGFLNLGRRTVPLSAIHVSLVSSSDIDEWHEPKLLPLLQTLVQSFVDPVDFWDYTRALLSAFQSVEAALLRESIIEINDFKRGVISDAINRVEQYARIWSQSNGEQCADAEALVAVLRKGQERTEVGEDTTRTIRSRRSRMKNQQELS